MRISDWSSDVCSSDLFRDLGIQDLSAGAIAVAVAGVFVGALLRGFTGFGLPLAAVPALTLVLAPALVVPSMLLLQILATLQALPRLYRAIHWPALAWLGAGALIGLPAGDFQIGSASCRERVYQSV